MYKPTNPTDNASKRQLTASFVWKPAHNHRIGKQSLTTYSQEDLYEYIYMY